MKKIYTLLALTFTIAFTNAQTPNIVWEKVFGGTNLDMATAIDQTADGGYIFVAFTDSNDGDVAQNHGNTDLWVVKVDALGVIQWQQTFGGSEDEYARAVHQTADGGYIIVATTLSNNGDVLLNHGQSDYWVIKLSSSGIMEWQKSYGGISIDNAYDIKQTVDGGYIVIGDSITILNSYAANHYGSSDVWIVKLNGIGTIEWEKSLGGEGDDGAIAVSQTIDGGYVVAAQSWSNIGAEGGHSDNDFYILKLTSTGTLEWQRIVGGTGDEYVFDILQLNDGSYVVAGNTTSTDNGIVNHGSQDGFVVKLSTSGELQWQKAFGGTEYDGFEAIEKTVDNKIIVSGYTHSYNGDVTDYHGGQDGWIVALSAAGELQWQKTYGSTGNEGIEQVKQTTDGGFVVAGTKLPLFGNSSTTNCWIFKLNSGQLSTSTFDSSDLKIYPNPVKEALTFGTDANVGITSVSIYNLIGQLVQVVANPNESIDVSSLKTGNYIIKIVTDRGTANSKFIKE